MDAYQKRGALAGLKQSFSKKESRVLTSKKTLMTMVEISMDTVRHKIRSDDLTTNSVLAEML